MFTTGQIIAFIVGALGAILTVLNIIDKHNTLKTRATQPFEDLRSKVYSHDAEISDLKVAIQRCNDRDREHDDTNEVLIHSVLALIEFEIQYCLTEHKEPSKDLERAKEDLHSYLSKR